MYFQDSDAQLNILTHGDVHVGMMNGKEVMNDRAQNQIKSTSKTQDLPVTICHSLIYTYMANFTD